jgi:uncharacterized protein with GYD domain
MLQASYTSDAWATQIQNPQNRAEQIQAVTEAAGGRLLCFYYAFGENDVVALAELPDNISAAALSIAAAGGSATKSIKTTVLMTPEEGLEAMRQASGTGYRPPGGQGRHSSGGTSARKHIVWM